MRPRAGMTIVPTLNTGHALVAGARGRVSHASGSTPQGTSFAAPCDRTVDIGRASLVEHLLDCLESGTVPVTSGDRARQVLEVMLAARRSAREARVVELTTTLPYPPPHPPLCPAARLTRARSIANEPERRLSPFTLTSTVNSLRRPWITTPAWSGSAIPQHLPQAQVSGMVRGQAPHPVCRSYPDRPTAESQARTRRTRSIDGWFGGMASVLAGRVLVREVRERSIGFRWRRPQPVKGAVDRGSSDAEQLGEFGLGVGAERVPMIGRRQDVKKRRTSRRFVSLLRELDGAYVVRLGPFRALCGVELHALTFIERPETGRLDGAVVDKHISAAAVDFNEAEALLAVEPLDSSLCHKTSPSISRSHLTTLDCCPRTSAPQPRAARIARSRERTHLGCGYRWRSVCLYFGQHPYSPEFPGLETSAGALGRAITRLPALARFAPRPLVLDLADQVSTHLREGMIKVVLVGGCHEVRPSR